MRVLMKHVAFLVEAMKLFKLQNPNLCILYPDAEVFLANSLTNLILYILAVQPLHFFQ